MSIVPSEPEIAEVVQRTNRSNQQMPKHAADETRPVDARVVTVATRHLLSERNGGAHRSGAGEVVVLSDTAGPAVSNRQALWKKKVDIIRQKSGREQHEVLTDKYVEQLQYLQEQLEKNVADNTSEVFTVRADHSCVLAIRKRRTHTL